MAIKRPDIYEHNNPNNAIVDSKFVRGGGGVTDNLSTLLTDFVGKEDQLKNNVTLIWVTSEDSFYQVKDKLNVGIISSWSKFKTGSDEVLTNLTTTDKTSLVAAINEVNTKGGSGDGSETKVTQGNNVTVSGTGTTADPYIINAQAGITTEDIQDVVGTMIIDSTTLDTTYNDTAGTESIEVKDNSLGLVKLLTSEQITSDILPAEQTKLSTTSNWTATSVTGMAIYGSPGAPALSGNEQDQYYFDGAFLYYFIADDYPIRLGGTTLDGILLLAGTVPLSALVTAVQNKITAGNEQKILFSFSEIVTETPDPGVQIDGPINSLVAVPGQSYDASGIPPIANYGFKWKLNNTATWNDIPPAAGALASLQAAIATTGAGIYYIKAYNTITTIPNTLLLTIKRYL